MLTTVGRSTYPNPRSLMATNQRRIRDPPVCPVITVSPGVKKATTKVMVLTHRRTSHNNQTVNLLTRIVQITVMGVLTHWRTSHNDQTVVLLTMIAILLMMRQHFRHKWYILQINSKNGKIPISNIITSTFNLKQKCLLHHLSF